MRLIFKGLPALLLFMPLSAGIGCKKHQSDHPPLFTGKYVFAACGHYLVQVLDGPLDSSMVMKTYTDPLNDSTYQNVFGVSDYCAYFGLTGIQQGNVFKFNFGYPPGANPPIPVAMCNGCMIAAVQPPVMQSIIDVQLAMTQVQDGSSK